MCITLRCDDCLISKNDGRMDTYPSARAPRKRMNERIHCGDDDDVSQWNRIRREVGKGESDGEMSDACNKTAQAG